MKRTRFAGMAFAALVSAGAAQAATVPAEAVRELRAASRQLEAAAPGMWTLSMITNRGVKVYPGGLSETFCTDHWRSRWVPANGGIVDFSQVLVLLAALHRAGLDVIKTEHLYTFDGVPAYSRGQGE